jgi:valyl-tRNA synthetase
VKGSEAELKLTKIPGNYRLSVDETKLASYKVELNDRYLSQKSVTDRLESRLSNKEYLNKAPQAIVKQSKSQLKEARVVLDNINDELKYFA